MPVSRSSVMFAVTIVLRLRSSIAFPPPKYPFDFSGWRSSFVAKSLEWQEKHWITLTRYRPYATRSDGSGAMIGAVGYGSGLNATRERTFVRNEGFDSLLGTSLAATHGSSEWRNAMIDAMSSSE